MQRGNKKGQADCLTLIGIMLSQCQYIRGQRRDRYWMA